MTADSKTPDVAVASADTHRALQALLAPDAERAKYWAEVVARAANDRELRSALSMGIGPQGLSSKDPYSFLQINPKIEFHLGMFLPELPTLAGDELIQAIRRIFTEGIPEIPTQAPQELSGDDEEKGPEHRRGLTLYHLLLDDPFARTAWRSLIKYGATDGDILKALRVQIGASGKVDSKHGIVMIKVTPEPSCWFDNYGAAAPDLTGQDLVDEIRLVLQIPEAETVTDVATEIPAHPGTEEKPDEQDRSVEAVSAGAVSDGIDLFEPQWHQTTFGFDYSSLDEETREAVQRNTTEIRDRVTNMRYDAAEIGRRLIDNKKRLGHGKFGEWLAAEFPWSDQTAQNFMRLFEFVEQNPKFLEYETEGRIPNSGLQQLAARSTPAGARAEVEARLEAGEVVTTKEVKTTITRHKVAERAKTAPAPEQTILLVEEVAGTEAIEPEVLTPGRTDAAETPVCERCGCTPDKPCEGAGGHVICGWEDRDRTVCARCEKRSGAASNDPETAAVEGPGSNIEELLKGQVLVVITLTFIPVLGGKVNVGVRIGDNPVDTKNVLAETAHLRLPPEVMDLALAQIKAADKKAEKPAEPKKPGPARRTRPAPPSSKTSAKGKKSSPAGPRTAKATAAKANSKAAAKTKK